MAETAPRRVLLKLSGESLAGETDGDMPLSAAILEGVCLQIREARAAGTRIGLVVGGGNIFRGGGVASGGLSRINGDYMGMLATLINALALRDCLERLGVPALVLSALAVERVAPAANARDAVQALAEDRVVVFAAGTGNPFFTTDTAAALRAVEIGAVMLCKATRVDGVYDADPEKNPQARRFDRLGYMEVLNRGLRVMDATAISLCMDNDLPVCVFDMHAPGAIRRALLGEAVGTVVSRE